MSSPTHPGRRELGTSHARSVQRIMTQNLVHSAIAAESRTASVSRTAIEDLSALINLVVLHDELYVLSRAEEVPFSPSSDLVDFLADEQIIRAECFDAGTAELVESAARQHLLHFLGTNGIQDTRGFKELLTYSLSVSCQQLMGGRPDGQEDQR
jgi:hypothetical protein